MALDHTSFHRACFFTSLDRTSCHWIGVHVIGSNFMSLDWSSCHWIRVHVIGSEFMSLDRSSRHWIGLHVIGSEFMSLDRSSWSSCCPQGLPRFVGGTARIALGTRLRNSGILKAELALGMRLQTGLKWFRPLFKRERKYCHISA